MKNKNTKIELIEEYSHYHELTLLKADGLDDAILGIEEKSFRLIYSKQTTLEILMQWGMTYEEANEYYYYNIECAWVGDKTPIWCMDE